AAERVKVRGVLTTITFSQRLAAALRPLRAEPSQARCHNDRACGRTHPCRIEAQCGVLEPRISENPLTDPALRLFGRFRRDCARGGACLAVPSVPLRGTAGSYGGYRPQHLVCRVWGFRGGRCLVHGLLRLLFYGAPIRLRDFPW